MIAQTSEPLDDDRCHKLRSRRFLHPIEYALMLRAFLVAAGVTLASVSHVAAAQQGSPARPAVGQCEIRGRLFDSASGHAVTTGSIAVRRVGDSLFVSGALPKEDGSFRVDGLRPGRVSVRVRAIGFAPIVRNDVAITAEHPAVDLGALALN